MKKLNSLAILAIAAIGLFACSKAEAPTPADTDSPETPVVVSTHTVTFEVGNPETKTSIIEGDPASYLWSSDDATRLVVKENSTEGTDVVITPVSSGDYSSVTFSATFADSDAPYVYNAFLAGAKNGSNPMIPVTQTPSTASYDPNADILVAKETDSYPSVQASLSLRFKRVIVPNKMTLKGLTSGETVTTVRITSDKAIAGTYDLSSGSWVSTSTEIVVKVARTVPASGELDIWFVTMPQTDAILTVEVYTDSYVYGKTFGSTISFAEKSYTVFGVGGLNATKKSRGLVSGSDYVIIDKSKTRIAWEQGPNNLQSISVLEISGDDIYYDPDENSNVSVSQAKVTVTRVSDLESEYYDMYTLVRDSKYLFAASASNNYLRSQDDADVNAYWYISTFDDTWSVAARKSSNRNIMRYYKSGTNELFSCYQSASNNPVTLIPLANAKPTPVITVVNDNLTPASIAASDVDMGISFNSNTNSVTVLLFADEDCTESFVGSWVSVDAVEVDGDYRIQYTIENNPSTTETRTVYVKIIATNSDSHSGAPVVVSLTQDFSGAVNTIYRKISGALTEGDYIIVSGGTNAMRAYFAVPATPRFATTAVSVVDDEIKNPDSDIVWHLSSSVINEVTYWSFYNASIEKYAASANSSNDVALIDVVTDLARWSVTGSESYEFTNKGSEQSQKYIGSGTQSSRPILACYTKAAPLTLYKLVE